MKKKLLSVLLAVAMCATLVCGCGGSEPSEKESQETKEESVEEEEAGIEVEKNLFSVEITVPSSFFVEDGAELPTQEELDQMATEAGGDIKYTLNEDGRITCKMSKAKQKEMLEEFKTMVDDYFKECTAEDNPDRVASFKSVSYNEDLSEINVVVDKALYGGFDAFYAFGFELAGYYSQTFAGVDKDQIQVIVNFVDEDGNVIESADSKALFEE